MIIGIEGPAGAGKSTMARTVAAELGAVVVEGGAWYRALTFEALQRGMDLTDTEGLIELASHLDISATSSPQGSTRILIGAIDVTDDIYSSVIDQSVAGVAQQLPVRSVIEPKIIAAVRAHGNVIIVGRHLRKALPEAAVLRVRIDEREAESRYKGRMGEAGESVAGRNARDAVTARLLGQTSDGVTEVDVTGMSMDEQADALRQFATNAERDAA